MKNKQYLVILFLGLTNIFFAQQKEKDSQKSLHNCIQEVYQDQADAMVFNHPSQRFNIYKDFYKNVFVEYRPELATKKITSTDDLALNNEYNSNLKHDSTYNSNTFNPIKYEFPFIAHTPQLFRIAQTDYIVIISPTTNR